MASPVLAFFLLIAAIYGASHGHGAHHSTAAPAPAVDCSSLILNMADCLTFVSAGSTVSKPPSECCTGLKTVLKTDAECLCEAFKSSASFGVTLNVTKALTLPSACKVSAPSASKCNLSLAPAGAPAMAPSTIVGANDQAPAPSPGVSSASMVSMSVGSLIIGLVAALFCSF